MALRRASSVAEVSGRGVLELRLVGRTTVTPGSSLALKTGATRAWVEYPAGELPIVAAGRTHGLRQVATYHPGAHIAGLTRISSPLPSSTPAAPSAAPEQGTVRYLVQPEHALRPRLVVEQITGRLCVICIDAPPT